MEDMFIGMKVNHKVFGKGTVVNVIDRPSGTASHEQYVDVEFENPTERPTDAAIHPGKAIVLTRRFTPTSLKKFLVSETE